MLDNKEEKKSTGRSLIGWLLYLLVIIGLAYLIVTFVGQRTRVSGSSMETTLSDGDNLIVDKLSYRFQDPQRFDIVVFPYKYEENTYYIKRIIGLPGETIQIKDGQILIDGETYQENGEFPEIENAGVAETKVALDSGEYFVLGDNRNYSSDSRDPSVALIHRKEIIGRAWLRIWPLNSFGILKHQ